MAIIRHVSSDDGLVTVSVKLCLKVTHTDILVPLILSRDGNRRELVDPS
jgi:hypothetical protein